MSTVTTDKPQVKASAGLRKFNKAQEQVNKAVTTLGLYTIVTSSEEVEYAMSALKGAKEVEKAIEAKRTELVKPLNEQVKAINTFAKNLTGSLIKAIDTTKKAVLTYQDEEEKKVKQKRSEARIQQLLSLGMEQADSGYTYQSVTVAAVQVNDYPDDAWAIVYNRVFSDIQHLKSTDLQSKQDELELIQGLGIGEEAEVQALQQEIESLQQAPAVETITVPAPGATGIKGSTKRWTFEITDATLVPREFLMVDEKKVREAIAAGSRAIAGINIYQEKGLTIR